MTNPVVALGSASELLLRIGAIAAVVLVAALVSWRRRTTTAAPTQPRGAIPAQLDRSDFDSPEMPWLVVVFTSATCSACEDVAHKASVLVGREVAVQEAEYVRDVVYKQLHEIFAGQQETDGE